MRIAAAGFGFAIVALVAVCPAQGQTLVNLHGFTNFDTVFDEMKGDKLKCNARSMDPWIDFGFRFVLRYSVECELKQFGGVATELKVFLRVQPEDRRETVFGDRYLIPAAPKRVIETNFKKLHSPLQVSGAVAAGAGAYDMDLLLMDNHRRVYRRHWRAKAFPRGREQDLNFSLPPGQLAEVSAIPIPAATPGGNGTPLTVLLNAAPLYPWARKLRAWDRAFLLDSLSSLLRQLSYSSVRVVAFNLDQQQEIFHQDNFGQSDMPKLNEALRHLELGKISYSTLQHKEGWAELLLRLLKDEADAQQPPQALVFLGPTLRLTEKVPDELLARYEIATPPLFCVSYYPRVGADFPDSIQYLTSSLKGKIFRIHTPTELAQNLAKLQHAVDATRAAR